MPPSTLELLRDILREAEFLAAQSAQTTEAEFLHNEVLKRAFVRSLEVIGEATKRVSDDARQQVSELEWRKRAGMRDKLIHDYGEVDYFIVWDVAARKTPNLIAKLRAVIGAADDSSDSL